ncbi:hypothetical protein [Schaalia sp. ZJ1691]|uniref:hypothetical protein n=1 Tax=Schaalia sp. ZJ1691 TaxID=2709404 RepID=UPI0013EBD0DD|nr:hypothetical protein [Schaalia sp. ZJ1691]
MNKQLENMVRKTIQKASTSPKLTSYAYWRNSPERLPSEWYMFYCIESISLIDYSKRLREDPESTKPYLTSILTASICELKDIHNGNMEKVEEDIVEATQRIKYSVEEIPTYPTQILNNVGTYCDGETCSHIYKQKVPNQNVHLSKIAGIAALWIIFLEDRNFAEDAHAQEDVA